MVKLLSSLPAAIVTGILASGCSNDASDADARRSAAPLDPIDAILDAFATHDIVALGDFHHDPQLHDFRMRLIEDPRLPNVVRDVVFEFGTPQQQVLLDRYVSGDDVSSEELRASADGIFAAQFLEHSAVYRDFFVRRPRFERYAAAGKARPNRAR